jgi:hypothetical protein
MKPNSDAYAAASAAEKTPKKLDPKLLALYSTVAKKAQSASGDYRTVIKHTGAYLNSSMSYAYSKAVIDVLKILLQEIQNESEKQP